MMSPAPRDRTRVPLSVRVPVFGSGIHSLVFGFAAALSLPCTSSAGSPGAAVFQLFFRVLAFRFQSADACYARAHGPPAHPTSLGHANSVVRYAVWCSQPRGLPAYRPTRLCSWQRVIPVAAHTVIDFEKTQKLGVSILSFYHALD